MDLAYSIYSKEMEFTKDGAMWANLDNHEAIALLKKQLRDIL